jgi:hypothetical protein
MINADRWVYPVIASVIASILVLLAPAVASYLLTFSAHFWTGAIDEAYRHAVEFDSYMLVSLQQFIALACGMIVNWFALLRLLRGRRILPLGVLPVILSHTTTILSLMLLVMFLASIGLDARSAEAHGTYERRMMVLAPVFSNDERNRLIAVWGDVQTKSAYDALMAQMEELANKYNISLPKRRDQ